MVNEETCLIKNDVPAVLDYLFTTYRKVIAEELKDLENSCLDISFDQADSMVITFHPIKQLQNKPKEQGSRIQMNSYSNSDYPWSETHETLRKHWENGMKNLQRIHIEKCLDHILALPKMN